MRHHQGEVVAEVVCAQITPTPGSAAMAHSGRKALAILQAHRQLLSTTYTSQRMTLNTSHPTTKFT
jgi:hypothetical protein